jgi:hypothetical protein
MISEIDLVGYAAPMMVLLMTREMILRTLAALSHVAVVIISIAVCLLPVLLPHLMLLQMCALRLWDIVTGTSGAASSQYANGPPDRSRVVRS